MFSLEASPPRRLNCLAFSPDGLRLATCGEKGVVKVWSLPARAEERCPTTGRKSNDLVFFGADGSELFALRRGPTLLTRPLPAGKWRERTCPAGAVRLITPVPKAPNAFCHLDGRRGEYLGLVSLPDFSPIRLHQLGQPGFETIDAPQALACSADGNALVCADFGRCHLFSAECVALLGHWGHPVTALVSDIAVSPGGRAVAFCAASTLYFQRLAPDDTRVLHRLGKTHFMAVAWHPSGAFFATANGDGKVDYWDGHTGQHRESFDWKAGKLLDIAFDPTGDRAAACSEAGVVVVWDVDR